MSAICTCSSSITCAARQQCRAHLVRRAELTQQSRLLSVSLAGQAGSGHSGSACSSNNSSSHNKTMSCELQHQAGRRLCCPAAAAPGMSLGHCCKTASPHHQTGQFDRTARPQNRCTQSAPRSSLTGSSDISSTCKASRHDGWRCCCQPHKLQRHSPVECTVLLRNSTNGRSAGLNGYTPPAFLMFLWSLMALGALGNVKPAKPPLAALLVLGMSAHAFKAPNISRAWSQQSIRC